MSPKFHCTEEILTIVSLLSVDSVLHNPPSRREEVQGVRKKFVSSEGDHMTLLNIYRTFKNLGGNKVSLVLLLFSRDSRSSLLRASLFLLKPHKKYTFPLWLNDLKNHKKKARHHFGNASVLGGHQRNVTPVSALNVFNSARLKRLPTHQNVVGT